MQAASNFHGLIMHQLEHEVRELSIRLHQLRLGTDEAVRHLSHAFKESILFHPYGLIHPIGYFDNEIENIVIIPRDGGDLGHGPAAVLDAGHASLQSI